MQPPEMPANHRQQQEHDRERGRACRKRRMANDARHPPHKLTRNIFLFFAITQCVTAMPIGQQGEQDELLNTFNLLWPTKRRRLQVAQTTNEANAAIDFHRQILEDEGEENEETQPFTISTRAEKVAMWDADVVCLQETRTHATAIRDARETAKTHGKMFLHGKPCRAPKAQGSPQVGVAMLIRKHLRPRPTPDDLQDNVHYQACRWQENTVPIGGDAKHLTIANAYGHSGAASDPKLALQTRT